MAATIDNTCTTKGYRQMKHALHGKLPNPGQKALIRRNLSKSMRDFMAKTGMDPFKGDKE